MILDSITSKFSLDWSAEIIVVHNPSGFCFIELVVEEAFELLEDAFIKAALIAFIAFTKKNLANLIALSL